MGTQPGGDPFWKNAFSWLPPEATLFGAVNLRPFGSPSLDDPRTQAFLRAALPEAADKLTAENLGRVRIDDVSLAYYEGPKPEDARGVVHLGGLALDGRKRVIDFIRRQTAGEIQVERSNTGQASERVRLSGPELPFALGIFDDNHVYLAAALHRGAGGPQHRKALQQVTFFNFEGSPRPAGDALTGYNPPWVRAALAEVPADACGLLLGEIPAEVRKLLTEALGLRVCPRTFVCHLKRQGGGVDLSLSLNVDRAGAELLLQEDLEKWRRKGLSTLQANYPQTRKEPEALALVGQALKTMQWGANAGGGGVRTHVHVSGPTWKALTDLLRRVSGP